MTNQKQISVLNRLLNLNWTSEQGFRIAAESVNNRGLKALLKAYARQRTHFAAELNDEILRLGGAPKLSRNWLGTLHRGWLIIKASMTIGREATEAVVLSESHRGETYAVKQYEIALKRPVPPATHALLARQQEAVTAACAQIQSLHGQTSSRLVVRLFENENEANQAAKALEQAGFQVRDIQTIGFHPTSQYKNDGAPHSIVEAAGAGALSGALLGSLLGLSAGVSLLFIADVEVSLGGSVWTALALLVLTGLFIGGLFGSLFGVIIGQDAAELDAYLYANSTREGQILMMICTEPARAEEATAIMRQVNLVHA
jgi:uncharacterized protein (TIGR02284 family)